MRFPARVLALLSLAFLAACGSKTKGKEGEPSSDPRAVVVDEKGITVGGERVGDAPPDELKKAEGLFTKLRDQREDWKTAHPDQRFDGVLVVSLGPNVTCQQAMSVYMTAMFTGYPNITLQQGDKVLHSLAAVPLPPDLDSALSERAFMEAHVVVPASGDVELKPKRCSGAYDVVPMADLAATVKEMCGEKKDCPSTMRMRCEAGVPMSKLFPVLQAVYSLSPEKMTLGMEGTCKPGQGLSDPSVGFGFGDPNPWGTAAPTATATTTPTGKKREGKIREGSVSISGPITEDEARAAMKPVLPAILECFERALINNPNLQGRITPKLAVGKKGAVMEVANGGSDLPDSGAVKCVVDTVSTVTFPAKGKITVLAYPLMLSPK